MKTTLYVLGSLLISLTAGITNSEQNDKVKISIVHREGNTVQVYDTIYAASSGYSVTQFLQDKGFDASKAEIIYTRGDQGMVTHEMIHENRQEKMIFPGERFQLHDFPVDDSLMRKEMVFQFSESGEHETGESKEIIRIFGAPPADLIDADRLFDLKKAKFEIDSLHGAKIVEVKKYINSDGKEETRVWVDGVESENVKISDVMEDLDLGKLPNNVSIISGDSTKRIVIRQAMTNKSVPYSVFPFSSPGTLSSSTLTIALVSPVGGNTDLPVQIANELPIKNLQLFPNPNRGQFQLQFDVPDQGRTDIRISSADGKQVYSENLGNYSGPYQKDIDISGLSAGTYVLNIRWNGVQVAEKIILQ